MNTGVEGEAVKHRLTIKVSKHKHSHSPSRLSLLLGDVRLLHVTVTLDFYLSHSDPVPPSLNTATTSQMLRK